MQEEKAGETSRLTAFVVAVTFSSGEILSALRQRIDAIFCPALAQSGCFIAQFDRKPSRASLEKLFQQSSKGRTT